MGNCPTKPNKTKVGPCQVCITCQNHYDEGRDPVKFYEYGQKFANNETTNWLTDLLLGTKEEKAAKKLKQQKKLKEKQQQKNI